MRSECVFFPSPLKDAQDMRMALVEMAKEARASSGLTDMKLRFNLAIHPSCDFRLFTLGCIEMRK